MKKYNGEEVGRYNNTTFIEEILVIVRFTSPCVSDLSSTTTTATLYFFPYYRFRLTKCFASVINFMKSNSQRALWKKTNYCNFICRWFNVIDECHSAVPLFSKSKNLLETYHKRKRIFYGRFGKKQKSGNSSNIAIWIFIGRMTILKVNIYE